MPRFDDALASNPAPRVLGDVTLRYEPSMLIGETARGQGGWRSLSAWITGVACLLAALGAVVLGAPFDAVIALLGFGALGLGAAVWLERLEKRRRAFVANFVTVSLRLDFSSPIAGHPRTLVVPFDAVRAVSLWPQADGASCLCVDFEHTGALLREALVAHIAADQLTDAERLTRVLEGAFGLGERPPTSGPPDPGQFLPTSEAK